MKKFLTLMVSILIVIAFAMVGSAEEKKAAEKAAPAKETKAEPAKEMKAGKTKVHHVTGDVTAVDAKAMTVTVKKMVKKEAKEAVLTVDDKTKIMMGKDKKSLADIKAGDKVTAKYVEMDGKNMAKSIDIKAAKAEKKMEKKEEMKPAAKPAEKPAAKPAAPAYK